MDIHLFSLRSKLFAAASYLINARVFCSLLVISALGATAAPKAGRTAKGEIRVTMELQDGSRIVGQPTADKLEFASPLLGEFKLGFAQVRSVEWLKEGEARVKTANQDQLQAKLAASEIHLKTSFGDVTVPVRTLCRMLVSSFGSADLRDGLLALWSGENNARDSVEAHHGTMMHGAQFGGGKVGQAFEFNSDQARVYIPDAEDFLLRGSFSVACWVKVNEYNLNCISQRGCDRPGMYTWSIAAVKGDAISFSIATPENCELRTPPLSRKHEWFHLVCVYDRDVEQMRIFINGKSVAERDISATPIWDLDSNADPSVCIGNVAGKFHRFPFRGLIDECVIYGRALTESDAAALAELGNSGEQVVSQPEHPRSKKAPNS